MYFKVCIHKDATITLELKLDLMDICPSNSCSVYHCMVQAEKQGFPFRKLNTSAKRPL